MMRRILVSLLFCLSASISMFSQGTNDPYSEKTKTLDSTLTTLYNVISGESGEARNWELFKYLFHPNAKLIPASKTAEGAFKARYMSPDEYIASSGKWLVENGFFEKEIHRKVARFGKIAQVFSTYESFRSKADTKPFCARN